jgi:hypothetical protein
MTTKIKSEDYIEIEYIHGDDLLVWRLKTEGLNNRQTRRFMESLMTSLEQVRKTSGELYITDIWEVIRIRGGAKMESNKCQNSKT